MGKFQILRLVSIAGAVLVGFWLPLRLIGFVPSAGLEMKFDLMISCISVINLYLHFEQEKRDWRKASNWLTLPVLADLACVLPLSLLVRPFLGAGSDLLLFVNLLAARHIQKIKAFLDHFGSLNPVTYRLVPLLTLLPLIVHFAACGWIALGSGTAGAADDRWTEYVRAVYFSFTTLTTVGYGDISAKTIPQMLYCCVVQVTGVGVFGYILSNVASLLSRADAAREHHMDNLERIERFMRLHHTPQELKSKIRGYYHYLWMNKKGYEDRSILDALPGKLQSDLFFHINRTIIEKVPFLKGASQELLEDLMGELEPRIVIPGQRLFRVDEPGDALYFIQSGQVEILGRDQRRIVTLGDGAFFGEMALVSDRPRNATAMALSYCDLFSLSREAFDRVTMAYPEFKSHILQIMQQRTAA